MSKKGETKDLTAQFFLSGLSHEIRTPLNGIVGYTQLLNQTSLTPIQKTYLVSMNRCCIQLMELINDILDFSKLATDKTTLSNECFDIKEIIEEVNATVGYRIKEKKQQCRFVIDEDIPQYIVSDKQKIIQILVNLITNASKFTKLEGRIIVSITIQKSGNKNLLEFSVEDNGIGIGKEEQRKLFDAFYQVQASLSKMGTGLGLAICKKLVELLGGTISVESEKDMGSIFTFTVGYEKYESFEHQVQKNSKVLKNKLVLIVDDNVDNRLIIGEMLFSVKMRPVICSSAKEALRMVSGGHYQFSVALLDICMPDVPGTDLAKQIKSSNPELPLIALSSIDEPFDKTNFDYILSKPVNNLRLIDCLTKVIAKDDISSCRLADEETKEDVIDYKEASILIAEDVSYSLDMLVKMLQSMGYNNIDTCQDGVEAIGKLEKKPYDILLLDLKMPRKDGFDVAKYLSQKKSKFPKTAVLTASILESDKERCRKLGIKYFILKPINMSQLRVVLKHMSSESESRK